VSRGSTVCWGDSTGTNYPEESWELTKYLFTPEALEAYWQILWVAPPSRLSVVTSDAFKDITGLSAGGIEYPGIDSEEEFELLERWIVTTLENGWDTQEGLGDNFNVLAREMDAAIESVMIEGSSVGIEEAINAAVENANKEIVLNR